MQQGDHVNTEAQRQALESMSSDLVRKLNIMIMEQEQRAREFAATHHSTLPTPAATVPPVFPEIQTAPETPKPAPALAHPAKVPPQPAIRKAPVTAPEWEQPVPQRIKPRPPPKTEKKEEENNVGMGMVIFALIGIIMLIRSCS